MIPVERCPACGGSLVPRFSVAAGVRTLQVSTCQGCGSCVKDPWFDAAELAEVYAHYDHHEKRFEPGPGEIDNLVAKVRRIERFVPAKGRLLEVGCGRGYFLREAARRGWDARGVELEGSAREQVLPEVRDRVVFLKAGEDVPGSAGHDVVCSYQVFEHLPEPARALRSWVGALRPGGFLVLDTPNAGSLGARRHGERWIHHARPDHFVLYTRKALEGLFRENGLSVVHRLYGGSPAVGAGASPAAASSARRVFRSSVLTRFLRSLVHRLGLGDNIELIGRTAAPADQSLQKVDAAPTS